MVISSSNNSDIECLRCDDMGVIETGNNDLPCVCPLGAIALFNVAGVNGAVTGTEIRRHFQNGSPEPIRAAQGNVEASTLPGRQA